MERDTAGRIAAIARCDEELYRNHLLYANYPDEKRGIQVGELDWLEELHGLLHEE